jgi:hypothetical protein
VRVKINALDFTENDPHVRDIRKNAPGGPRHVSRRQIGGRDLIKQRLEEMVVAFVDDRYVERLVRKPFCRREAAEARATTRGRKERFSAKAIKLLPCCRPLKIQMR